MTGSARPAIRKVRSGHADAYENPYAPPWDIMKEILPVVLLGKLGMKVRAAERFNRRTTVAGPSQSARRMPAASSA